MPFSSDTVAEPLTTPATSRVGAVVKLMKSHHAHEVQVIDRGSTAGYLTALDLLGVPPDQPIGQCELRSMPRHGPSESHISPGASDHQALAIHSDRLRSLGEMAAGIAHELNQPLVGVRGLAEHLLVGLERGWEFSPEKVSGKLERIIEQVDRMTHLIEHIRMFAREAGKPETVAVEVNDVIDSACHLISSQFRAQGIEIQVELGEALPPVKVNPFSLEEVILNLLNNARDAIEDTAVKNGADYNAMLGRIVVCSYLATDGSDVVHISISDTGAGIPEDMLERVFDPFVTTKGPNRGTGLGLAISRSIIGSFSGDLRIESSRPGQTIMNISLPHTKPVETTAHG